MDRVWSEVWAWARAVAGAFGGIAGANVLAIVGDAFPEERRGRAMGVIMSAFSFASIAGVPAGLWLAEYLGWRTPFAILGGLSTAILLLAAWALPPLRGHLAHGRPRAAGSPRSAGSPSPRPRQPAP